MNFIIKLIVILFIGLAAFGVFGTPIKLFAVLFINYAAFRYLYDEIIRPILEKKD